MPRTTPPGNEKIGVDDCRHAMVYNIAITAVHMRRNWGVAVIDGRVTNQAECFAMFASFSRFAALRATPFRKAGNRLTSSSCRQMFWNLRSME
jgi:hypothetical protein